jgi:hypothetical protein
MQVTVKGDLMAGKASGKSRKSSSSRGAGKRKTAAKRRTAAPKSRPGTKAKRATAASHPKTSPRAKSKSAAPGTRRAGGSGGKVGSSEKAARRVGGRGDFGAEESDRNERNYASRATRRGDPGASPGHNIGDGTRVSGVGGSSGGAGASSGGDLDTDVIGVGTGGTGLAESGGTDRTRGADITEGEADTFAAEPPLKNQGDALIEPGKRGARRPKQPKGDFLDHSGGDESQTDPGEGAANVTNSRRNDDSFAGEISNDEAAGADNAVSDNE